MVLVSVVMKCGEQHYCCGAGGYGDVGDCG